MSDVNQQRKQSESDELPFFVCDVSAVSTDKQTFVTLHRRRSSDLRINSQISSLLHPASTLRREVLIPERSVAQSNKMEGQPRVVTLFVRNKDGKHSSFPAKSVRII